MTFMQQVGSTPNHEKPVIARPQAVAIHEVLDCRVAALLAMTKFITAQSEDYALHVISRYNLAGQTAAT